MEQPEQLALLGLTALMEQPEQLPTGANGLDGATGATGPTGADGLDEQPEPLALLELMDYGANWCYRCNGPVVPGNNDGGILIWNSSARFETKYK